MPHITARIEATINAVTPIAGNTEHGSAAYDPSTGQALYAVYNPSSGNFEMYRTTDGFRTLVTQNNSVTFLATILDGPFPTTSVRNIGLTRIGGVLYATICGSDTGRDRAGMWIYRDTSAAADGTGPWVEHGTVGQVTISAMTGSDPNWINAGNNMRWGGEIIVFDNGNWGVSHHYPVQVNFGGTQRIDNRGGTSMSTNGGVAWSPKVMVRSGSGSAGSIGADANYTVFQMFDGSSCFGKIDGYWYWGLSVNSGGRVNHRSNGGVWTRLDQTPSSDFLIMPFSTDQAIYWDADGAIREVTDLSNPAAGVSYELLFNVNDYGLTVNTSSVAVHACDIGPSGASLLAGIARGKILRMSSATGWTVGHIGMA